MDYRAEVCLVDDNGINYIQASVDSPMEEKAIAMALGYAINKIPDGIRANINLYFRGWIIKTIHVE